MIEVRISQDEWLTHLGPEQTERLMKRAKEGHKVRVRIYLLAMLVMDLHW